MKTETGNIVLVGVLKDTRDLEILLTRHWYRIPASQAPARQFQYLAFYQPAVFGREGKRIRYYARVLNRHMVKRSDLLRDEPQHERARDEYVRFRVGSIRTLPRPVRNIVPRRISFGFTTLHRLLTSKNMLQVYDVVPTEEIVGDGLAQAGINATPQYYVVGGEKRYCLDFAVFCKRGAIALECDNKKAHSGSREREKDAIKTMYLRRRGWTVIRLAEHDIVSDLEGCIQRVGTAIRKLGGCIRAGN